MSGQQTSPAAHLAPSSPSAVHRWPGLTGVRQCLASLCVCASSACIFLLRVFVLGERGSVGVRAAVGLRVGARGLAGDADLDAELRPTPGRSRREGRAERPRAKDGAAPRMDDGERAHLGEGAARFVRGALGGRTADLGGRSEAVLGVRAAVLGGLAHGAGLRHGPRGQAGDIRRGNLKKRGRLSVAHIRVEGRRRRHGDRSRDGGDNETEHRRGGRRGVQRDYFSAALSQASAGASDRSSQLSHVMYRTARYVWPV